MSSNLTWEPVSRNAQPLADNLKWALQKRYGGTVEATMDTGDIPYLEGLRDGGLPEAQFLIDAIEKHDRISVKEEF